MAAKVVELVGGKENIADYTHCFTRLRFTLKDEGLCREEELKNMPEVTDLIIQGGQHQVVIGPNVGKVYAEVEKIVPLQKAEVEESGNHKKGSLGARILGLISGSIIPIVPVLMACGIISVVSMLLGRYGTGFVGEGTINLFNTIADAGYYFLPFYLAFSCARKLNCNEYLAAMVAGILVHPNVAGGSGLEFFGLSMPVYTYASTIVPIFLSVLALSYVEKFFRKIMPDMISYVFVPVCTMLVMGPVALFITGPFGGFCGKLLADLVMLVENMGFLSIPVFAFFFPLLVMTGMHTAVIPLMLEGFSVSGYSVFASSCLAYTPAMAGATLAVAVKSKNRELKSLAATTGASVILAASEPALYGVLLRLKKPLFCAMAASAIGGIFVGLLQIKRYAMGIFNIFTFVMFIGDDSLNIVKAVGVYLFSFVLAFGLTYVVGWKED